MIPSRILVTGLGSFWGGRVAQALERIPGVETVVGLDTVEPSVELENTEFVHVDSNYSILSRIVKECGIEAIIHTFLVVDASQTTRRQMHETNVIGTMNLFAAAGAPGSTVKRVVVKSSTVAYGCNPEDPVFFDEDTPRSRPARSPVERSLEQVEGYVRDFAVDNPDVAVALLRFSNVLGTELQTPLSRSLELPFVPMIAGFDPRFQFVHEDDVVRSILFALDREVAGLFNVAGDGLLPWSEVIAMAGKRPLPLPPIGEDLLVTPFRALNLVDLPDEYLRLLRFGRGVDNRRLKAHGFDYEYTSAQTVAEFVRAMRLRQVVSEKRQGYKYERDVEQFFRHSPAVLRNRSAGSPR